MPLDDAKEKLITVPESAVEDHGKRVLTGTLDAMLVFNDQATQTQRSIKFSGYTYSDDNPSEINKRLDAAWAAMDRQFLMNDLKRLEKSKYDLTESVKRHRDYLKELSDRQSKRSQGDGKVKHLTSKEKEALDNGDAQMLSVKNQIESIDKQIEETKKKCGIG